MSSNPDNPLAWLDKAEVDMLCIKNNLDAAAVPWKAVAFHAQQAAEKTLKAFPVSKRRSVLYIHDLEQLRAECIQCGGSFENLADDCELLTPFAVLTRYPGFSVNESNGRKAVAAAERIRRVVLPTLAVQP